MDRRSPEDDPEVTGDQFFYNIQDPLSCYHCRIPELLGKRIRGSFHGWLILSNDKMWSLWNPVTSNFQDHASPSLESERWGFHIYQRMLFVGITEDFDYLELPAVTPGQANRGIDTRSTCSIVQYLLIVLK
ncbi:hypothetical protein CTI12_AA345240 [Artemisia annua]|uniref:Uncharacterized protein n=1 Tax=Artemisia annua TaxID=35608 RepID=A0A2U1MSZ3_ARTAN|nr:hypothetical protein CTI12_AA345240 [Artemisia annua]